MKGIMCGAGLLLLAGVASAQVGGVATCRYHAAEPATGQAHRADAGNATLALRNGDIAAARPPTRHRRLRRPAPAARVNRQRARVAGCAQSC
jgi:hypothetical protein